MNDSSTRKLKPCGTIASYNRGCRCDKCREGANAYRRERYAKSPQYRAAIIERQRRNMRDPEYRRRRNEAARRPEYREKRNVALRKRYREDAEYRQRIVDRERQKRSRPGWNEAKNQKLRERYANDPEYRARVSKQKDKRYRRLGGHWHRRQLPKLIERDGAQCGICKRQLGADTSSIHVDHIVPLSRGGLNRIENLRATHARCNISLRDRNRESVQLALQPAALQ